MEEQVKQDYEDNTAKMSSVQAPDDNLDETATENENSAQEVSNIDEPQSTEVPDDKDHDWFIIQTYSSQEYKVRSRIEMLIDEGRFKKSLFRVLVPEQESVEIKNNKRTERVSKIFPGYVFIQMIPVDELSYEIKALPGVSKFVGTETGSGLVPVQEDEILKVLRKVGDKTKEIDIDFELGEVIKVISGPFRGYSGSISEINPVKGKLKINDINFW